MQLALKISEIKLVQSLFALESHQLIELRTKFRYRLFHDRLTHGSKSFALSKVSEAES